MPTDRRDPDAVLAELRRAKGVVSLTERVARPLPAPPEPGMSEAEFMAEVVALAKRHKWLCYHTRDSRRSEKGFPDLVLVKAGADGAPPGHPLAGRVVVAELKAEGGKATAAQLSWLEGFRSAGTPAYLWKPSDLPEIESLLGAG